MPRPATPGPRQNRVLCGITGDPSPDEADLRLNRSLSKAARILQIQMLDYVIIGHPINCRQRYFSFKETGTIG
jgi:DNA repair protein RadC